MPDRTESRDSQRVVHLIASDTNRTALHHIAKCREDAQIRHEASWCTTAFYGRGAVHNLDDLRHCDDSITVTIANAGCHARRY